MKTNHKTRKPSWGDYSGQWKLMLAAVCMLAISCNPSVEEEAYRIQHRQCLVPGGAADNGWQAQIFELAEEFPPDSPPTRSLTWERFKAVRGELEGTVLPDGLLVELSLSQLIPNGVYTLWIKAWEKAGTDAPVSDPKCSGVLGLQDGSESAFVASPDGTARVEVFTPNGRLSMFGEFDSRTVLQCLDLFVVGVYHLDNKPGGPQLLADGSAIEQFGFPVGR